MFRPQARLVTSMAPPPDADATVSRAFGSKTERPPNVAGVTVCRGRALAPHGDSHAAMLPHSRVCRDMVRLPFQLLHTTKEFRLPR